MPRKPKATRPNANTAGAIMSPPSPAVLTPYATAISANIVMPSQKALKFPATNPGRMLSDAPPCCEEVTISCTCRECMEVNTFTSSGMIAPARVPQVITSDSFHHSVGSPPRSGIKARDTTNVSMIDTIEVSQTSVVSGASKFILSTFAYRALAIASLMKYDSPEATIIMTRITKIQTSSWTLTSGVLTASRMNEISATPVTP